MSLSMQTRALLAELFSAIAENENLVCLFFLYLGWTCKKRIMWSW